MTRRLNVLILALLVLIGAPYYWYLLDNRPGDVPPKAVTIAQLRQLASARPGPAPKAVEVELVSFRRVPGTLFAAGIGLKRRLIGVMVWRLPVDGTGPIVIDSGLDAQAAESMGMESFNHAAWGHVKTALAESSLTLITHEHPDHLGGLLSWAGPSAFAKAQLNGPQQIAAAKQLDVPVRDAATVAVGAPFAVAPGVVAIPAASHTPGSQMIFVRLADGREYLFTGDIATLTHSWRELRARSRLVGAVLAPEDRREVYAWLKTIRALKVEAPRLIILTGHDYEAVFDRDHPTGVKNGFSLSQINAARP
ncbi:MAG: MBL fold metallo-hydrolase [Novosphingobium sp.]|uniref:MBL fold metallo-hydrolase n=1 Tax=Novosphingobium sp. TaxID=1874826 RepID=UPI0032B7DAEF